MKHCLVLLLALSSLSAFSSERVEIAKSFTGDYRLASELWNDTEDESCAPQLVAKYWEDEQLLDLQFLSLEDGVWFVNQSPLYRGKLENAQVIDVINKLSTSNDGDYETETRINNTRIEQRIFKVKSDKKKLRGQVFFSQDIFSNQVRIELIDKDLKRIKCLYNILD